MISYKGTHFPKDIILYAVFFYVRYAVSYRDLEEILEERGVKVVDHAESCRCQLASITHRVYVRRDLVYLMPPTPLHFIEGPLANIFFSPRKARLPISTKLNNQAKR